MSEAWDFNFWKQSESTKAVVPRITISTSTDTAEALDDAVHGRESSDRKPSFRYTEMRPHIPEQDGTIEHSDPRVVTDVRAPEMPDVPVVHRLSPELEAAALENFEVQADVARSVHPDFDTTLNQPEVPLSADAQYLITTSLPNGALLGYYLGKHRQEAERLNRMTHKDRKAWLIQKSAEFARDPAAGLDTADFTTFRRVRNAQIRDRFK